MSTSNRSSTFPSFFLVGTGRSGTTLARTMLTGHPAVAIPGETGFLPTLLRLKPVWWGAHGLREDLFGRLIFANGRLARAGLTKKQVADVLGSTPCSSHQEAISRVYGLFTQETGASLVGDKTPGYLDELRLLGREFPEAKVIQMVRHPLDVVASLRKQPWGPDQALAAAWVWRQGQERAAKASLPPSRHLVVRLEDLIASPEETLGLMAGHLGLSVEPGMLEFEARADRVIGENIHPESHAGLRRTLAPTRQWSDELTPRDAELAWAAVAPVAEPLGYEGPGRTSGATAVELRARAQLLAFNASRSWRRARTVRRLLVS